MYFNAPQKKLRLRIHRIEKNFKKKQIVGPPPSPPEAHVIFRLSTKKNSAPLLKTVIWPFLPESFFLKDSSEDLSTPPRIWPKIGGNCIIFLTFNVFCLQVCFDGFLGKLEQSQCFFNSWEHFLTTCLEINRKNSQKSKIKWYHGPQKSGGGGVDKSWL